MAMRASTRREFLGALGMGLAAAAGAKAGAFGRLTSNPLQSTGGDSRPPNIVLVFTDDQGYGDLGCYGSTDIDTPNIDRLAAEGVRFTDFYVSQAVCSSSRASLMTGCYSERVGIVGALGPNARIGISADEETIADLLKTRGYATAVFGKWHLGHHRPFLPLQHGFDEYLGLPYSNDMWPVSYDGKPFTEGQKSSYPPLWLIRGNEPFAEIRTMADQDTLTTRYTEAACAFIDRNRDRPFFLYVPHSMPHTPLGVSDKFRGKSRQGPYGDVIQEIDWSVGRILDRLKTHGLEANTWVIFTSDNGPWMNFGKYGGSAGPLREGKGTMFEGGPRVPCVMRWPGRLAPGRVIPNIAASIDLLPSIAAACGAPRPKNRIDGVDLWPLLEGRPDANPRDHFFYYYERGLRAVRQGRWKLMFPHKSRSYTGVPPGTGDLPGPYAQIQVGLELYDLETDIGETKDVAAAHPDIVARLQALAETAREDLGDSLTERTGKGIREPGRIPAPGPTTIVHAAVASGISVAPPPSPKYPVKGPEILVDGRRGSLDFRDGNWLGYEGEDFEAVIDLGKEKPVESVGCGFYHDPVTWIFLPVEIEVELSKDGLTYAPAGSAAPSGKAGYGPAIEDLTVRLAGASARYVRLKVKGVGVCPPGHPGAGGKAWVFADEIIVR
jgi:arylsulfatase A-like enzyme